MKYTVDMQGLTEYLKSIKRSEIETNWQKTENPKLVKASLISNIEYFGLEKETPLCKVIQENEPFLVELFGNDLSVAVAVKRKYRLPNGKVVHAKLLKTLIADCEALYGDVLMGYWKIPPQFLTKK